MKISINFVKQQGLFECFPCVKFNKHYLFQHQSALLNASPANFYLPSVGRFGVGQDDLNKF